MTDNDNDNGNIFISIDLHIYKIHDARYKYIEKEHQTLVFGALFQCTYTLHLVSCIYVNLILSLVISMVKGA